MLSDLHILVHSLNKREKQYFQRFASRHVIGEKNNYLKLFEAIRDQKQLDEGALNGLFRGQNLYLLKRHLQNSILKALRSFNAPSSVSIQVHSMIDEIEVLHKKGLTRAGLKLLHHAKKFAQRHEQHLALLQLMEWEIRLLHVPHKLIQSRRKFQNVFREEDEQMEFFRNFREVSRFRLDIIEYHNRAIVVKKQDEVKHREIEKQITHLARKKLSTKAQWQLFNAGGVYFSTVGDFSRSSNYFSKATALFRHSGFLLADEMQQYLFSLYLQSATAYNLKNHAEALRIVRILHTSFSAMADFSKKKNLVELHLYSLMLESILLLETGAFKKALPVVAELKEQMDIHLMEVHTTLRSEYFYQQSIFWFCGGEFARAQQFLNKILQDPDSPRENASHYCFARLMQLIILLELQELRQIENLLPATRKYLRRKGQHYRIEDALLNFIAGYAKNELTNKRKTPAEIFTPVKLQLLKIAKDPNEAKAFNVFDYISWLESKIENIPLRDILGQRN